MKAGYISLLLAALMVWTMAGCSKGRRSAQQARCSLAS